MATFQTPVDIQASLTVDGPVGIGTAEPAQKLSVAGIIESTSGGIKFPDGSIQATAVSGAANVDGHSLDTADGSQADVVFVDNKGNVGIGTTNPGAKLHVAGDLRVSGAKLELNSGGADAAAVLGVTTPGAQDFVSLSGGSNSQSPRLVWRHGALRFGTATSLGGQAWSEKLRITDTGNVGIGTTTPRASLEVAGDTILGGNVGIGTAEPHARLSIRGIGGTALTIESPTGDARNYALQISYVKYGDFGILQSNAHEGNPVSAGTTALYIDRARNVGIGTTEPRGKLEVNGTRRVAYLAGDGDQIIIQDNTNSDTWIVGTSSGGGTKHTQLAVFSYRYGPSHGWAPLMIFDGETGNIGIGTTNPGTKLDVADIVRATRFVTTSDLRLKTNVAQVSGVLEKLAGLQAVSFDWNEQYQSQNDSAGQGQLGLIAQDVEAVFPELVSTLGEEGYKAVDYGRLTAVLVEAVRELRAENATLRERTEVLEKATAER